MVHHLLCGAQCGALLGTGVGIFATGWFRDSWNIKKVVAANAALVLTGTTLGALSTNYFSHSVMHLAKPFADCGGVGMVVFGAAAGAFKLLVDESIYGNYKAFAASLACGLAATYIAAKTL